MAMDSIVRTPEPVEVAPAPAPAAAPLATAALWALRCLVVVPFVLLCPELLAAVGGRPDAMAHVSASANDVLGTAGWILFVLMLTVTPVRTVTGWRWHEPLRRDLGVAMAAVILFDLFLAGLDQSFAGGFLSRIAGRSFLAAGTVAALLLVPLAVTANRRAQRRLGRSWKALHRLVYVIWGLVLLHLLLLFGFRAFFLDALVLSVPLVVLRLAPVSRWWAAARRAGTHRVLRATLAVLLLAVFAFGLQFFVRELAYKGHLAFVRPSVH
ncbi:MAG TPA: ferric reductase-like transmembrane domain-containing protein [Acidimicrobiales bacterium]|nr:ferric reductase-like transmembrane domain-containing protein [Acidimicrobiales bacterium]